MKGQTSTSALKRFMNKDNTVGHVFAFPFIFGFVCFSLIPVCISFYYAFTNYSLGSKTAAFIGFKNFLRHVLVYAGGYGPYHVHHLQNIQVLGVQRSKLSREGEYGYA